MRPKPTREEVADAITRIEYYRDAWVEDFNVLKNAYLAQEEELNRLATLVVSYGELVHKSNEQGFKELKRIADLEAENKALKASMEAEYIERQAKHIQELVKENEALKAKLEGTFKFDEPKRGEALRYVTDDETGVVRVKGETNHD